MEKPNLYFLALVPHRELLDEITGLKEEMRVATEAKSILKSPAHITIQKPFKRNEADEPALIKSLSDFSRLQKPFRIELDGFDSFPPRVIFIGVKNHDRIIQLHSELKKTLTDALRFSAAELMNDIHPHVTLTTRYLTPSGFNNAWPDFRDREYSASFTASELCLLKHDGQKWNIYRRFRFEG